jgi:glucokinase
MSILGVDLGGTNVRAGMVKNDRLVKVVSSPIDGQGSQQEVLEQVCRVIDPLVRKKLKGIGVGVPSVVDLKNGIIYDVVNIPSWKRVPLRAFLEKRYLLPVYINNDANCFAVGEKYFGQAKKYDNVVGLIVGTGLGAGVIANGKLYSGANCGTGEFGMISYLEHNHEYYASGQFFKNAYKISGRELFERANLGDKEALRIFAEFGAHLGEAVKTILYAVDPDIIVLGGSVSQAYRFFRQAMWESIKTFVYSLVLKNIKIRVSRVRNIAILGAAALYYDALKK